jgi:hypothetical protein
MRTMPRTNNPKPGWRLRMGKSSAIPATITLDADALAALAGSPATPNPLLENIASLLIDVRQRLNTDARILVDGKEAGRLLGLSERTIRDAGVPCIKVGASRRYRIESLKLWSAEREQREALATK